MRSGFDLPPLPINGRGRPSRFHRDCPAPPRIADKHVCATDSRGVPLLAGCAQSGRAQRPAPTVNYGCPTACGLLKKLGRHEKESASKNSFLSLLLPLIGRRSRRMRELKELHSHPSAYGGHLLPTKREKVEIIFRVSWLFQHSLGSGNVSF